jgi:hypothetical protein
MNAWESIFMQSPVNDGCYDEDDLPQQNWQWPEATWFQARLDYVRDHEPRERLKSRFRRDHCRELATM